MGKYTHKHGVACEVCGDATTKMATVECPSCVACVCDDCHERMEREDALLALCPPCDRCMNGTRQAHA